MDEEDNNNLPLRSDEESAKMLENFERTYKPAPPSRSRLSASMFGVLLPRLGETAQLGDYRENLKEHLDDVRDARLGDKDEAELRKLASEESMLNQVLQWISLDEEL